MRFPKLFNGIEIRNEQEFKAIELLGSTNKSYSDISKESGAKYNRVTYFGQKIRSNKPEISRGVGDEEFMKKNSSNLHALDSNEGIVNMDFNVSGKNVSLEEFNKQLEKIIEFFDDGSDSLLNFILSIDKAKTKTNENEEVNEPALNEVGLIEDIMDVIERGKLKQEGLSISLELSGNVPFDDLKTQFHEINHFLNNGNYCLITFTANVNRKE